MKKLITARDSAGFFDEDIFNMSKEGKVLYFLPNQNAITHVKNRLLDKFEGIGNIYFRTLRGFLEDESFAYRDNVLLLKILEDILKDGKSEMLKAAKGGSVEEVLNYILHFKENFVLPEDLTGEGFEGEIRDIYTKYEEALLKYNLTDRVSNSLTGLNKFDTYFDYKYIVVDSYYKFDKIEEKLLEKLSDMGEDIFIISPVEIVGYDFLKAFERESICTPLNKNYHILISDSMAELTGKVIDIAVLGGDLILTEEGLRADIEVMENLPVTLSARKSFTSYNLVNEFKNLINSVYNPTKEVLISRASSIYFPLKNKYDIEILLRNLNFKDLSELKDFFKKKSLKMEVENIEALNDFVNEIESEIKSIKGMSITGILKLYNVRKIIEENFEKTGEEKSIDTDFKLISKLDEIEDRLLVAKSKLNLNEEECVDLLNTYLDKEEVTESAPVGIDTYLFDRAQGVEADVRAFLSMDPTFPGSIKKSFTTTEEFLNLLNRFDIDPFEKRDFNNIYKEFKMLLDSVKDAYFLVEKKGSDLKSSLLLKLESEEDVKYIVESSGNSQPAFQAQKTEEIKASPVKDIKKNRYSPSQIQTYINCPYLFYLEYILGLEVSNWEYEDKEFLDIGNFYHKILENYFKNFKGVVPEYNEDLYREIFSNEFKDLDVNLKSIGEALYYERLKAYIIFEINRMVKYGLKPEEFEKPFEITIDDIKISGRIDRIDLCENGMAHIVDYKSGTCPSAKSSRAGDNLQLQIYAMAAADMGYKVGGLSFGIIKDAKSVDIYKDSDVYNSKDTEEILNEILVKAKEVIATVHENIKAGNFEKSENCTMNRCAFYELCGGYIGI